MFERSLSALIKGLRSHRGKDEPKYVAQVMDEIRHEVRSGDMEVKAEAVLKLTYLQMLGYPHSGASFHMLETMASAKYHHKHVGYLAAAQCFSPDTDVLILATNMIKKDLQSSNPLDVAIALNGLSHIVTPDLARHLGPDVVKLLTHSRPMIRKKALLVLYAMIIKCPDMLEVSWDRLREKLEDPELGVVSAAVNIICELARRDPRPFLPLSPQLFRLLTTSTNNWMLIKIIKLFGALTPLEPRLVKKLVPPITTIISTTPAMSLLYECIHTIIIGGMLTQEAGGDELAETCVEKLAHFLTDSDQNLKYIALLALVKILPSHPHLVAQYQEVIFESIEDSDLSIRLRALELVSGMAVSRNLESIVSQLLSHLEPPQVAGASGGSSAAAAALKASLGAVGASDADPTSSPLAAMTSANNPTLSPSYRLEIVNRILALGSYETYSNVLNFRWYIDTLLHLALITNLPDDADVGPKIRDQLIDITSRVRAIRPHAIQVLTNLLRDPRLVPPSSAPSASSTANGEKLPGGAGDRSGSDEFAGARKVLHAAAWVLGEYCYEVPSPSAAVSLLLQPGLLEACDASTSAACVHNAVKLFAFWSSAVSERWSETGLLPRAEFDEIKTTVSLITAALERVPRITEDAELQERAVEYRQLFGFIENELRQYGTGSGSDAAADKAATNSHEQQQQQEQQEHEQPPTMASAVDEKQEGEKNDASRPPKSLNLLSPLFFNHTLGPVALQAQARVPLPADLDLEAWIVPPADYIVSDGIHLETSEADLKLSNLTLSGPKVGNAASKSASSTSKADAERAKQARLERQLDDPFYISTTRSPATRSKRAVAGNNSANVDVDVDVDSIPIVQLDLNLEGRGGSTTDRNTTSELTAPVLEQEEMPDAPTRASAKKKSSKTSKKSPSVAAAAAAAGATATGDSVTAAAIDGADGGGDAQVPTTKVVTKKKKKTLTGSDTRTGTEKAKKRASSSVVIE
ncbi:Adaptor protein complex AP-3 delta subunit [Testicularia cyperi]|uniref:AP-3 complex subunit delta n=1 Tax=Testicularia cyperi TaxID=1882483 RepID=A0A317XS43_9BASI|nr:Adaptor protein complex AP-3 delta subunit [Testicularia cyperi]